MARYLMGAFTILAGLAVTPIAAFAEGSVKVECQGRCDLITVGQACDAFSVGSTPVAIACDDTAVGAGTSLACGLGQCRGFGSLVRGDRISDYCADGPGFDVVVTCRFASLTATAKQEPDVPKVDDGEGDDK